MLTHALQLNKGAFTRAYQVPNPDRNLDHNPYICVRWSESGLEFRMPSRRRI